MASQKYFDDGKKRKKRSSMVDKIPVMAIAGARRNKNLIKLKQDLEERARASAQDTEPKIEVLYVDTTRNVGVVLGKVLYIIDNMIGFIFRRKGHNKGYKKSSMGGQTSSMKVYG